MTLAVLLVGLLLVGLALIFALRHALASFYAQDVRPFLVALAVARNRDSEALQDLISRVAVLTAWIQHASIGRPVGSDTYPDGYAPPPPPVPAAPAPIHPAPAVQTADPLAALLKVVQ